MDTDRTEGKAKRHRSPAPKLAPLRPLWKSLDPERKELIVAAFIGNLVSAVVDEYMAETRKSERQQQQGDATCE